MALDKHFESIVREKFARPVCEELKKYGHVKSVENATNELVEMIDISDDYHVYGEGKSLYKKSMSDLHESEFKEWAIDSCWILGFCTCAEDEDYLMEKIQECLGKFIDIQVINGDAFKEGWL